MPKTYKEKVYKKLDNNRLVTWSIILFSAVSLVLAFYTGITDLLPKELAAEDRAYAKQLIVDLENAKSLLPEQQSFLDCMEKRNGENISVWGACIRERKSSDSDPVKIFEKNISLVKLSFSKKRQEILLPLLERLHYLSYEMQNNQGILSYWLKEGCSSNIQFSKLPPAAPNPENAPVRCTLVIQPHEKHIESTLNDESASALRKSLIALDDSQIFIFEGQQTTIESYFAEKQNLEFKEWRVTFEVLIEKTKSILL